MQPVTDPDLLAQLNGSSGRQPVTDPELVRQLEEAPSETDILGEIVGATETGAAILSGAIAEPLSGWAGMGAAIVPGGRTGAEMVEHVSDKLTYDPSTPEGRRNLQSLAKTLRPLGDILQKAEEVSGDAGYDLAGPVGGALASALPVAVLELLGLKGAKALSRQPKPVNTVDLDQATSPEDIKQVSANLKRGDTDNLASAVNADPEILGAAEELNIDINPGAASQNRAFIEAEQSLKSRPGSLIASKEEKSIRDLQERADQFIVDVGGGTDKSLLDAKVRDDFSHLIDGLTEQSDQLYREVEAVIQPATKITASHVQKYLDSKLSELGGDVSLLTGAEKRLKALVDSGQPTYAALDRVRKNVGDGFKRQGIYADDDIGTLEQVYSVLIRDQQQAANSFGVGDKFKSANDLVFKRKSVEKDSIKLYGRELQGSLVSSINAAANGLPKGNVANLRKLMESVPSHLRGEVAASVLNDLFSAGSRNKNGLGGGFVNAYEGLKRNQGAMVALFKYLPEGSARRFNLIGKVATGIYRSKALENNSRTARDIIAAMDDGGMFEKIYGVGKQIAGAEAVSTSVGLPGAGSAGVIGAALAKKRTPATQAADELIASGRFSHAVKVAATGKVDRAEAIIKNSPTYKKWARYLPKPELDKITARGFIPWLIASSQLSKDQNENREDSRNERPK